MRCKHCEYELWHCTVRICPECGGPFSLADYVFEIDEVYYHCPECDHGILGDDPQGRPSVLPNICESCGNENMLEDFVIKPAPGYDHEVDGLQLPIRTLEGNAFTRYFSTVWLIMTKPKTAMARIPSQEPISFAWKFYLTTFAILFFVSMLPSMVMFVVIPAIGGQLEAVGFVTLTVQAGAAIVFSFIFILTWALIVHAIIRMSGECKYPFKRTMQSVLYGGGVTIVGLVPCCGGFVGWIWWVVASTNMLIHGHRITKGRAIFASVGGTFCILLLSCGAYILLVTALLLPATTRARNIAVKMQLQQHSQLTAEEIEGLTPEQLEILLEESVTDSQLK